jgi:hypothetical protein
LNFLAIRNIWANKILYCNVFANLDVNSRKKKAIKQHQQVEQSELVGFPFYKSICKSVHLLDSQVSIAVFKIALLKKLSIDSCID